MWEVAIQWVAQEESTRDHRQMYEFDEKGSVIENNKSFSVVLNPNFIPNFSVYGRLRFTSWRVMLCRCRLPIVTRIGVWAADNDLEEKDLKLALGKKRLNGNHTSLQPLTAIQRLYVKRMVEKYCDDYQSMFRDIKLNEMQHSVATLEKLCKRYHMFKDQNPLIVGSSK